MAEHGIPNLVAIKYVDGYVYCATGPTAIQGYVGWKEENVFSPLTKIAVETAKIDSKYVHLRFCCNNRYWALDDEWLVAESENPDDNKSNRSCTLFQPIFKEEGNSFHLVHVQSERYVQVDLNRRGYLCLGNQETSADFRFVDLDSLVMLPKHVTFKGDNGKYLEAWEGTILHLVTTSFGNLSFSSDDGNAEATAYEVTMNPHGYVLIKSKHTGKYWRANPEKVTANNDAGRSDDNTLFWPVKVNDRTIALRNAATQKFCRRDSDDALSASASNITNEARLQLEELVLERKIDNVVYREDKMRIYDQRHVVLGEGSATNKSTEKATLIIDVTYENFSCYSFKSSIDFNLDVKTHFEASIPQILGGTIDMSLHISASRQWNEETKKSLKQMATYEADVPPGQTVTVKYVATEGKYDIPFSYTQRDRLSGDGSTVITTHDDGLFTGTNYLDFDFQQVGP